MNTLIAEPDNAIRKISGNHFRLVRLLPVQLTQLPASTLQLKQLRMMAQVRDHELFVRESASGISAFMALQFTPGHDSSIRFLLIKYFATDRFALHDRAAAQMEETATRIAAEAGCTALLVRANALNAAATKFYRERGYALNGQVLIKSLT
ncbi:MAG: hypothetical protein JST19_04340 [Bacteroidetes bacterium]|nr:hypothetical protein [Bacteroidota bacterium]